MVKDFVSSLIKFCVDQIAIAVDNGLSTDLAFINLDAHANISELPATDLLGLTGFATEVDGGIHSVSCAFCVMTIRDVNMFRHYKILDQLYRVLQPERTIGYYDADTADYLGWMVLTDGTMVTPVSRSETRALQFIQVNALVNPGAVPQ